VPADEQAAGPRHFGVTAPVLLEGGLTDRLKQRLDAAPELFVAGQRSVIQRT